MTLKYSLDETKTPRVLTVTSDRGFATVQWAGDTARAIFTPAVLNADGTVNVNWKLVSNDGTTAVFNG